MGELRSGFDGEDKGDSVVSRTLDAQVATVSGDIPGDTSTTAVIAPGETLSGQLETADDQDWFRLTLEAGQAVEIDLAGSGMSPLADPALWLYDSTGAFVAFNDDGPSGRASHLTFIAPSAGTWFVAADSIFASTGGYQLAVSAPASTGDTIPAGTGTQEVLAVGGTRTSALDYTGDRDWFRMTLADGEAVTLGVAGAGASPLDDPILRVYDSSGTLLADFDDGPGATSSHRFVPPEGGTYFVEVDSYGSAHTGDYVLDAQPAEPPRPVDAVRGYTRLDTTDPVKVYFAQDGDSFSYGGKDYTTSELNAYEAGQLWSAIESVEAFTNIDFEITTDRAAADLEWGAADLGSSLEGFFFFPKANGDGGYGLINDAALGWSDAPGGGLDAGGYMYGIALHEFGHALGLAHTHDTGNGSIVMDGVSTRTDLGSFDLNQTVYTAMSYNDGWRTNPDGLPGTYTYGYAESFGAIDIAALQEMYGVNTTFGAGDDVYALDSDNGALTGYACLWDTGGTDEIRHDGTADAVIDLRAATLGYEEGGGGFVSHVSGVFGGFTIARGVVIENATGGSGDDMLTGNSAANVLRGGGGGDNLSAGAGADVLDGGTGEDVLSGGTGADIFRFVAGDGSDRILDFDDGSDVIDLLATGVSFDQLDISDDTNGVLVAYGATGGTTDRIEIAGVSAAQLSAADFLTAAAQGPITGTTSDDMLMGTAGPDSLSGGEGDDTLAGGASADILDGGPGSDTADYSRATAGVALSLLTGGTAGEAEGDSFAGVENVLGSDFADTVTGSGGANVLDGGAGDDTVGALGGADHLSGGAGADWMNGGVGNDSVFGGADNDELYGGGGADAVDGGDGDDTVFGAAADDSVTGGIGADQVYGGGGDDVIDGGDGIDGVFGAGGRDDISGGAGDDMAYGGTGADSIQGGIGLDEIYGGADNDTVDGGAGDDRLFGVGGDDSVAGGADHDEVYGGGGADRVDGGDGDDLAFGAAGNDSVSGGIGLDELYGGADDDSVDGGAGNNRLFGVAGDDSIAGGADHDEIYGGGDADTVDGGDGDDLAFGAGGIDHVFGGAGNDSVYGGSSGDTVDGGTGDDRLFGQGGGDTLIGGAGDDVMNGGPGEDVFLFSDSLFGHDTIVGWQDGDDLLDFTSAGLGFADFTESASAGGTLIELAADTGQFLFLAAIDPATIDASDFA